MMGRKTTRLKKKQTTLDKRKNGLVAVFTGSSRVAQIYSNQDADRIKAFNDNTPTPPGVVRGI